MKNKYVLDKDTLVCFLIKNFSMIRHGTTYTMTEVILSKTLYFLYAYWFTIDDKELFKPNFIAGDNGPYDPEVLDKYRNNYYDGLNCFFGLDRKKARNIIDFIFYISLETFFINDFTLIDMSKSDISYKKGLRRQSKKICSKDIKKEYANLKECAK